jgi:hypothetical protein
MSNLHKILIGAMAVQLALAGFVWTRSGGASIGALEPLVALDRAAVTALQVTGAAPAAAYGETAGAPDVVELVKRDGGWVLASHHDYPADPVKVDELLDKLTAMRSRGPVATGAARARQLEVDDAGFQRKLVVTVAGQPTTLYIGAAAGARRAAVRLGGQDAIHGVAGVTAYGFPTQPGAYVASRYLELEEAKVASVTVKNPRGSFELVRAGAAWTVAIDGKPAAPPAGEELDTGTLAALVRSASTIEIAAPADPGRPIEAPEATITVRLAAAGGDEAVSTPDDERVIDLVSDTDDRYRVRERGSPRAVLVDGWRLRELVELDRAKLFRKPDAAPPGGDGAGDLGDLPPEILEQLRQQGVVP